MTGSSRCSIVMPANAGIQKAPLVSRLRGSDAGAVRPEFVPS